MAGEATVLIVPGLLGSPIDFDGAGDLVANLQPGVQNIVVLNYPSAPGVAATANALYDLLRANDVTQFAYVPDAGHKVLIDRSLADPAAHSIPLTTEEEGVALDVVADVVLHGDAIGGMDDHAAVG